MCGRVKDGRPFTIRNGFPPEARPEAARLFWQAFSNKLGRVMRPEARALRFLERVMDPDHAISAVTAEGALLGMAGFKTAEGALVGGGLADLAAAYGWFGAVWRGLLLECLEREHEPGRLLMDGVFVREDARGLGIGSALLDAIEDEAARRGLGEVRLDVIDVNPRARALYERKGFRATVTTHTGLLRPLFGFARATTMVRPLAGASHEDRR